MAQILTPTHTHGTKVCHLSRKDAYVRARCASLWQHSHIPLAYFKKCSFFAIFLRTWLRVVVVSVCARSVDLRWRTKKRQHQLYVQEGQRYLKRILANERQTELAINTPSIQHVNFRPKKFRVDFVPICQSQGYEMLKSYACVCDRQCQRQRQTLEIRRSNMRIITKYARCLPKNIHANIRVCRRSSSQ